VSEDAQRIRDADRTREAILIAAEDFFARLGFERASVQQIAEAAGVARSTPLYFFGSKQSLYEAVLARAIARAQQAMAQAYAKGDAAQSPEDAVASYAGAAIDFLGRDQNFLRLMQREALGGGSRVAEFFGRAVEEGVAAFAPAAEKAGVAPQRLMLDLTALCWYPFAHEHTIMPALGMTARDPVFLDAQKRHIGDLVRAIVRRRDSAAGATPTRAGAAAPRGSAGTKAPQRSH
jgi:TetR/AcrR family transcriptional regulator